MPMMLLFFVNICGMKSKQHGSQCPHLKHNSHKLLKLTKCIMLALIASK